LANVDTGNGSVGLAPGTTHSSLESIGTSARQHLVDPDDVVRVCADTKMETFLSGDLDQVPMGGDVSLRSRKPATSLWRLCLHDVAAPPLIHPTKQYRRRDSLVGADTGSLESLGAQLFILVGNQVDAQGELVDVRTLSAKVEDADLGIRYTTVEPRLGVRL
jgi:hypothetical protein